MRNSIERAVAAMRALVPTVAVGGANLCSVDRMERPGEGLHLVKHFASVAEAKAAAKGDPDAVIFAAATDGSWEPPAEVAN